MISKMDLSYIGTDLFELGNGEMVESDILQIFLMHERFIYIYI